MTTAAHEVVIFDAEYTAWEGSMQRGWSGPGEYMEVIQIGAVKVSTDTLAEAASFLLYVCPEKNTQLSQYIIDLTGITQDDIDAKGMTLVEALEAFAAFAGDARCYSFGDNSTAIRANCALLGVAFPFPLSQFLDVRDVFQRAGVNTDGYSSGTISRAVGVEPLFRAHDALNNSRVILQGLNALRRLRLGQNPFAEGAASPNSGAPRLGFAQE